MRHAPDPGQGSLFASTAEPAPERRRAMAPNLPMANHAFGRHGTRPTATAAAVGVLPRSGTQRARVLEAIRQAPTGLTDQKIATTLGLAENSVRPRRLELSDPPKGLPRLIVDSGRRRQTSAGKQAVVWVAIEHAVEVAGTVVP